MQHADNRAAFDSPCPAEQDLHVPFPAQAHADMAPPQLGNAWIGHTSQVSYHAATILRLPCRHSNCHTVNQHVLIIGHYSVKPIWLCSQPRHLSVTFKQCHLPCQLEIRRRNCSESRAYIVPAPTTIHDPQLRRMPSLACSGRSRPLTPAHVPSSTFLLVPSVVPPAWPPSQEHRHRLAQSDDV
jgi:hypothetical protein